MTNRPQPRRGVSSLFVIGCVLWAIVFGGLLFVRFYRPSEGDEDRVLPDGTISESEDDGKPQTIVLEVNADQRQAVEQQLDDAKAKAEKLDEQVAEAKSSVDELQAAVEKATGDEAVAEAKTALEGARAALASLESEQAELTERITTLEVKVAAAHNGWSPDGLPDFELTERNGEKVTLQDLLGKPFVVAFVFTRCPGPCPKVSLQMRELQEATENLDLRLVTITVDPERDTPEVLRTYAETYGADPDRWLFLTGPVDVIYPLIGNGFAMPVQKTTTDAGGEYDVIHTSNLLYVGADGIVRGKYNSLDDQAFAELKTRLRRDVPKIEE